MYQLYLLNMFRSCLLATALSILPFSSAYANVLELAVGTWGTTVVDKTGEIVTEDYVCDRLPIHINIDQVANRYSSYHLDDSETSYADILAFGENWVKIQYDGEERLMSNDKPHIWILFMTDADTFFWIREDWVIDGRITNGTSSRHRCEPAMS